MLLTVVTGDLPNLSFLHEFYCVPFKLTSYWRCQSLILFSSWCDQSQVERWPSSSQHDIPWLVFHTVGVPGSVQGGIYELGKAHTRSTPPLSELSPVLPLRRLQLWC